MSTTVVEQFPLVRSRQVRDGLGWNVGDTPSVAEWMIAKIAAAGAVEVRTQMGWDVIENMAGAKALRASDTTFLDLCAAYGLEPLVVAAYGPPREVRGDLTVATTASAGATTIAVTENPLNVPYNVTGASKQFFAQRADGTALAAKNSYYGGLIDAADSSHITLASGIGSGISSGAKITVRKLLYAPIGSIGATDASVIAYCNYVEFLAQQIHDHGLVGRVELWNEPVWPNDFWDDLGNFYDSRPGGLPTASDLSPDLKGIVARLRARTPPAGVTYNFGGTHKTGFASLYKQALTEAEIASSGLSAQGIHPYSSSQGPEYNAWQPDHTAGSGQSASGNHRMVAVDSDLERAAGLVVDTTITEGGCNPTDQETQGIAYLRQYLVFHSLGVRRVNFFTANPAGGGFETLSSLHGERNAFVALKNLLADLDGMLGEPLGSMEGLVPQPVGYSADWPLAMVPIGGQLNRLYLCVWQRDYGASWLTSARPGPVTVEFATGGEAHWATNLISRADVELASTAGGFSLPVGAEPVGIAVDVEALL